MTILSIVVQRSSDPDQSITPVYQWMIGGTVHNGSSLNLGTTGVLPGDVVVCTISATDDYGVTVSDSAQILVDNRAPNISQVSIDNTTPTTNEVVTCSVQGSDPDGETLTESIEWLLNNSVIGNGATIDLSTTSVLPSDVVTCDATLTDALQLSAQSTATMTMVNSLPVVDSFTITPSNPTASDSVDCEVVVTEPDGESYTTNLEVQLNGSQIVTQNSDVITIDLNNYTVSENDMLECIVSVEDASGGVETQTISTSILSSEPVIANPLISLVLECIRMVHCIALQLQLIQMTGILPIRLYMLGPLMG